MPTRQRATERFVRLEQSRSQPGSGLGLSLAKAVMKFHGGRLDLLARPIPALSVVMVFPEREGSADGGEARQRRTQRNWLLDAGGNARAARPQRGRRDLARSPAPPQEARACRGLPHFLAGKDARRDFLAAVFDLSPFLRDCARRRAGDARRAVRHDRRGAARRDRRGDRKAAPWRKASPKTA